MRTLKIGINGFGRIGRLAMRVACERQDMKIVRINDPGADAGMLAHLLNFDSVHGRWHREAMGEDEEMHLAGQAIPVSRSRTLADVNWSDCDIVLECSGKMRRREMLQPYLDQGVAQVIVSAPVPEVPSLVLGVNEQLLDDPAPIIDNASCTTNCLAPIVKVIHEQLGIRHGSMTTIHGLTNDQVVLDAPHKDPRRSRSAGDSLIPTSTNSARAIVDIFPELDGRLDGHAVRVPVTNASLTDCVFEVEQTTTADEVNELLKAAADGELVGILGYEERPLVSVDYRTDPRSSIVDGLSTLVVNRTQVKVFAWYDNEWAYANRLVELAGKVGERRFG